MLPKESSKENNNKIKEEKISALSSLILEESKKPIDDPQLGSPKGPMRVVGTYPLPVLFFLFLI